MQTLDTTAARLDALFGITLFFLVWPLVNLMVVFQLIPLFDYQVNLGGFLLFSALEILSFVIGLGLLIVSIFARRKSHPPVRVGKMLGWVAGAALAGVTVLNLLSMSFYCAGACPSSH